VPSAEDALRVTGPIVGDRVAALSDGEPAERSAWVHFLAYRTFYPSLVAAARTTLAAFGVATECGMGYVPEAELEAVLRLHRDIADRLLASAP
jgi:hypothetical protein